MPHIARATNVQQLPVQFPDSSAERSRVRSGEVFYLIFCRTLPVDDVGQAPGILAQVDL